MQLGGDKLDVNKKIYFTLGIGYKGASWEDEVTLAELGYNPKIHKDLQVFLEQEWKEWAVNYIEGGWSFSKDN